MKYGILNWWRCAFLYGIRLYEGNSDGGGGSGDSGDGGDGDGGDNEAFSRDDLDKAMAKAVESATSGLKTKNQELIGEQKKLSDRLALFGDIDPKVVKDMISQMENDDDATLIKNGKIDELVAKKLSKSTAEFESRESEYVSSYKALEDKYNKAQKGHQDYVVRDQIMKAAIDAGVRKEAIDDVVNVAAPIFNIGDDGEIEARDYEGNLRKIGDKLFTPDVWLDSLRESKPHYWPESKGSGAQGNQGGQGNNSGDIDARISAAAAAGDHKLYRELRTKKANSSK